jgi:cell wall-associated NlpC family hydrolase
VPQHGREVLLAVSVKAAPRLAALAAILAALMVITAAPVAAGTSEADRVIAVAKKQIGDPWVHYAKGPDAFDCVGLVWYAFKKNDLAKRIGGYQGVRGYFNWFRDRGMVSTSGRPGDLVVWGKMKHIGINLGDGKSISALTNGVKVHPTKGYLNVSFKAFLRVRISR